MQAEMKKTILIVEDEPLIAMAMEDVVGDLGFSALVARTIEHALHLLETNHVDMAVLDYKIHGADSEPVGLELRRRSIPFLVCSGTTIDRLATALHDAPFLNKPFDNVEMQAMILAVLGG